MKTKALIRFVDFSFHTGISTYLTPNGLVELSYDDSSDFLRYANRPEGSGITEVKRGIYKFNWKCGFVFIKEFVNKKFML